MFKWCTDWTGRNAPSLLDMLINMFVSPFKVLPPSQILYEGQVRTESAARACGRVGVWACGRTDGRGRSRLGR